MRWILDFIKVAVFILVPLLILAFLNSLVDAYPDFVAGVIFTALFGGLISIIIKEMKGK